MPPGVCNFPRVQTHPHCALSPRQSPKGSGGHHECPTRARSRWLCSRAGKATPRPTRRPRPSGLLCTSMVSAALETPPVCDPSPGQRHQSSGAPENAGSEHSAHDARQPDDPSQSCFMPLANGEQDSGIPGSQVVPTQAPHTLQQGRKCSSQKVPTLPTHGGEQASTSGPACAVSRQHKSTRGPPRLPGARVSTGVPHDPPGTCVSSQDPMSPHITHVRGPCHFPGAQASTGVPHDLPGVCMSALDPTWPPGCTHEHPREVPSHPPG